jgi:hypothetical protein
MVYKLHYLFFAGYTIIVVTKIIIVYLSILRYPSHINMFFL